MARGYGHSVNDTFGNNFLEWVGFTTKINDRKFNSAEAQAQRDWEQEMSNTAYQRSVADMKAAGLNPAMMYASNGAAASTPTGSSAHANSSSSGNFLPSLINSSANLVRSFNNDKDKSNNLDVASAVKLVSTMAGLI